MPLAQAPVADAGKMLVDETYLQKYLVDFGNEKMEANWARTERFHDLFHQKMLLQQVLLVYACLATMLTCIKSAAIWSYSTHFSACQRHHG